MTLKLKSKKILFPLLLFHFGISSIIIGLIYFFNLSFNNFDFRFIDKFYTQAINNNKGPKVSDKIIYVSISDKTYNSFKSSILDRKYIAKLNEVFAQLSPQAVMYDIIFPRPSNKTADSLLALSIADAGMIYLPAGFQLTSEKQKFKWEESISYHILKNDYLQSLKEKSSGIPYYAKWAVVQYDSFAKEAFNSGHITAIPDEDGVYRHYPLVIKVDSLFFPTVTLAMFLDYNKIPFNSLKIDWGKEIKIPADKDGFLEKDLLIPIDNKGCVFIPYPCLWENSPKMSEVQDLLEKYSDENNLDDLTNYFEGNFVFVGDISTGIADLGQTVIEENVPLVAAHAALMNAFLTDSFYSRLNNSSLFLFLIFISILYGISFIPKSNLYFFFTGLMLLAAIIIASYLSVISHLLIPVFTLVTSTLLMGIFSLIVLQVISGKQEAFIKNAFSKYVPKKVVDELLSKPEMLQLGGEERTISILFSDIVGFTSISEKIKPKVLVPLLNEYLTEMTTIVLEQNGIIDKYIGDAILAEFGAPIPLQQHADAAVTTALKMQKKLIEMNLKWKQSGLPALNCRIGINSGKVVLGNMGSHQVFDYTAIGDNVNLASRLEGANKKYGSSIMISEFTFNELNQSQYLYRVLDVIKVKGKLKAVKVFEVYGFITDEIEPADKSYYVNYNNGFNHYLNKEFLIANEYFNKALLLKQNDVACLEMLQRISLISQNTLPDDWDGSVTLTEK